MDILSLLWGTVLLRPYVFVFLAVYLTIAILNMGALRSVIFTVIGYTVAFASEYSSTRNGFPYGFYSYIETTRAQELWISNVPFMDSLSYSFLAYVSFTMSMLLWSPLRKNGWDIRLADSNSLQHSAKVIFTGAALFMMLDVIIDPVAFLGDRWFLGKIYTYQEQGEYFNIPLTNFGGWFLVGTTILYLFSRVNRRLTAMTPVKTADIPCQALLGPGLYFGVLAFNLSVTLWIGEIIMGLCGTMITGILLALTVTRIRRTEGVQF